MNKIGLIGLGKIGFNLAINIKNHNLDIVGYDQNKKLCDNLSTHNIETVSSIEEMVKSLPKPRNIILLVPSGNITEKVFDELLFHLEADDCIIDAGNSFYQDSIRRWKKAKKHKVGFLDMGTSGGPSGALNGACLMVGGETKYIKPLENLFKKISVDKGYLHTGEIGSGHFSKMVHNAIEYGMVQSIAEGYEILENSLFKYDYQKLSDLWNNGSVVRGWLIELMQQIFKSDQDLSSYSSMMEMNGEGLWAVQEALKQGTPVPTIALSVMVRQQSTIDDSFSGKVVTALRQSFGGHKTIKRK